MILTNELSSFMRELQQTWPTPSRAKPIVVIGAGSIVNDSHLPAYRKSGLPISGIFDIDMHRSRDTAEHFAIPKVFPSLASAIDNQDVVWDIAVPPEELFNILVHLPERSVVLLQKPMGVDLNDAKRIHTLCREKSLCAAVNFQLRFSPMMLVIRDAVRRGLLGDIIDIDVRLNLRTPWEMFPYLKRLNRVEIQIHSIHYLDLIRSFLGEPKGVYARTVSHTDFMDLKSTRTSAILDYGDTIRCCLSIHHNYEYGGKYQDASIKFEGTQGAAVAVLGGLMNYPHGEPDRLELVLRGESWQEVPLQGSWFPDAFAGTMSNLQRYAAGEDEFLITGVEDAYHTMALVEACYESDAHGATPIPE